ncbi:MAG: hypothetical protein B6U94_04680 [Thermofilum sp. ex4484_79]|nr:MAG: hypothetical protein B6U94_04680 [Thermofilum sp. ex4484_79]
MKHPVYVIFQLDTEDFITPETDEVSLHLTLIFNKYGVKGSFAIVGEKARVLVKRKRWDIIEALKTQDIAYQSNYHSVHPIIGEYLKDKDLEEGVQEVIKRESPGLKDLEKIFGMKPSAFVQPGGAWAPQVPYAMRKLGIRVYADGIFEFQPVWFCNVISVRHNVSFRGREAGSREHLEWLKSEFEKRYEELRDTGGFIIVVLHPCILRTWMFWDTVNFENGKSPEKLFPAPLFSDEEYQRKIEEFDEFVKYVVNHPNVRVITFRELPELIEETPDTIPIRLVSELAKKVLNSLSYYNIENIMLSAAEAFGVLVATLAHYYTEKKLPSEVRVRSLLGPIKSPPHVRTKITVSTGSILEACYDLNKSLDSTEYLPSSIKIEDKEIGPGTFMKVLATLIALLDEKKEIPDTVQVNPWKEIPEIPGVDLSERVERQWKWIIYPRNFRSQKILEYTLLQTWTWKPTKLNPLS